MTVAHRIQRSFKPRFAVIYPFASCFLFFCYLDAASIRTGAGFIIAGTLLRLWSNGYAIKNDKLTTSGPYAFVRNPLYLGTFLVVIGVVTAFTSNPPWVEWTLGGLLLFFLSVMYYRTIKKEQAMLRDKFKAAYVDYCKHVPVIIPCLIPYSKGEKWPFSLQRLLHSKEHKTAYWIFILLVVFYLKTRIIVEHKGLNDPCWGLIAIALLLIIIDTIYDFNKKK